MHFPASVASPYTSGLITLSASWSSLDVFAMTVCMLLGCLALRPASHEKQALIFRCAKAEMNYWCCSCTHAGFFTQFGRVTKVRVSRNKKTGKAKGYGFLEFQACPSRLLLQLKL